VIVAFVVAQAIAIANVDVLTMQDGPAYQRARTVVITDGVISAMGSAAAIAIPPGAQRIDGTGMVLLPGLADMHVHLEGEPERWIAQFLKYGVTSVLNLRGNETHLALRNRIARRELWGPTVYTSGPYVNRPQVETEADAVRAAREQGAAGYDVIKIHGPLGNVAYRALLDSARIPVVGHAPRNLSFDTLLAIGRQRMVAHAEELIYTKFSALDTAAIGDLPARMAAARIWLVPTLTTFHGIAAQWGRPVAVDSALHLPEAAGMIDGMRRYWTDQNPYTGRPVTGAEWAFRAYGFQGPLVRALHRAGVRLMTGTDTPLPIMTPGASLHGELQELVRAGLSSYDALVAATRNPGDFIAEEMRATVMVGRVAPGFRADLILVRGDPLSDLTVLREPRMVIARGRIVPRD
jgi:imidazolonepropionase-like amidohydrolase